MVSLMRRDRGEQKTDGTMSLMEHLYELRRRLFFACLGLLIGVIIGFVWYTVSIPALHIPSLGDLLKEPYCKVPVPPRAGNLGSGVACPFLATAPFSILQVRLNAAIMVGAVLSSPVWLGQLWGFVTPALYAKEKRYARSFTGFGALLFLAGAVLAYEILPEALRVLLGFGGDTTVAALDPESYYSFLSGLLIIFGVSFEVPLLLVLLNFAGVLKGRQLGKIRRYAFFGMFVFAGLVVPGNDPLSMLGLAVSLCVLYEIATQISTLHDKRKAKRQAVDALSDDEATPALAGSLQADTVLGGAHPVDMPAPLERGHDFGDAT